MPRRAPGGGPLATPVYSQRRRQRGGSRHERKAWKKTAVSCCCHCGRGHRGSVPRYAQQNFLVELYLLRGALGRHESGSRGHQHHRTTRIPEFLHWAVPYAGGGEALR